MTKPVFRFETLRVWQDASAFASQMYTITRRYPDDEKFGLVSQTRRAAVSIAANISEGSGRGSDADFARFMSYAYASLMEVISHLAIAHDQRFITDVDQKIARDAAAILAKSITRFREKLLADASRNTRVQTTAPG